MKLLTILVAAVALVTSLRAATLVQFDSSVGSMVFELYDEEKPQTTQLFLNWLSAGNYDGTYVHRATNNYVAQSGRYGIVDVGPPFGTLNIELNVASDGFVPNEFDNGKFLPNEYGTIAMIPYTAPPGASSFFVTSTFLFNFGSNTNLDDPLATPGGVPVFGRLVAGWEAFDLLNPTNGNPALRVTNFSDTLPELPVLIDATDPLTFDKLVYLNMHVVPEPATVSLIAAASLFTVWRRLRRR